LMTELERTGDPRVSDNILFEKPPLTDPPPARRNRNRPKQK
jgi:hypothetical protein